MTSFLALRHCTCVRGLFFCNQFIRIWNRVLFFILTCIHCIVHNKDGLSPFGLVWLFSISWHFLIFNIDWLAIIRCYPVQRRIVRIPPYPMHCDMVSRWHFSIFSPFNFTSFIVEPYPCVHCLWPFVVGCTKLKLPHHTRCAQKSTKFHYSHAAI